VIIVRTDRIACADCGSTNGTAVNDARVGGVETEVDGTSDIRFGGVRCRIVRELVR
jgi:hypothetical protein